VIRATKLARVREEEYDLCLLDVLARVCETVELGTSLGHSGGLSPLRRHTFVVTFGMPSVYLRVHQLWTWTHCWVILTLLRLSR
jgi:hypothetical protein